jgi:hypothetical protein
MGKEDINYVAHHLDINKFITAMNLPSDSHQSKTHNNTWEHFSNSLLHAPSNLQKRQSYYPIQKATCWILIKSSIRLIHSSKWSETLVRFKWIYHHVLEKHASCEATRGHSLKFLHIHTLNANDIQHIQRNGIRDSNINILLSTSHMKIDF